jgi:hypothetical protein
VSNEPNIPRPDPAFTRDAVIGGRSVVVEFTQHYVDRCGTRGGTPDEVIACLRNPDVRGLPVNQPTPPRDRKRWGRYDDTGRRRLDVVFEEFERDGVRVYSVVSVFWKSGAGI